ncbi:MAG TPA: hypothetical protein VIH61_06895, partial [Waddliaceae bacterium]
QSADLISEHKDEEEIYGELAVDIERGLEADIFYDEEKIEKELLLAKVYLKLGRMHAAFRLLNEMKDPDCLLLTQCYIAEGTSPENVIAYGEKALLSHPEEVKLHLHLFNAYLELAKEKGERIVKHALEPNYKEFTRKAADHLEAIVDIFPLSLENRLWLAHYFAKVDSKRAIPLLEAFVHTETHLKRFDNEAFLLASLYSEQERLDEAELLLEKIVSLHQKIEPEAKLKLAEVYVMQRKSEQAKDLYQKLEESAQLGIAYAARLQLARLDFPSAPEINLKKLQELAVRKSIANEPIHLEAAIDYAEFKASTYPEEERAIQLLELLTQVKTSFTNQDDIWSKDYHASREFFPEKDLVYQAYMRYVDARMYLLEAQLTQDSVERKTKLNIAKALFSTLRQGKYAVSNYIKQKSNAL